MKRMILCCFILLFCTCKKEEVPEAKTTKVRVIRSVLGVPTIEGIYLNISGTDDFMKLPSVEKYEDTIYVQPGDTTLMKGWITDSHISLVYFYPDTSVRQKFPCMQDTCDIYYQHVIQTF